MDPYGMQTPSSNSFGKRLEQKSKPFWELREERRRRGDTPPATTRSESQLPVTASAPAMLPASILYVPSESSAPAVAPARLPEASPTQATPPPLPPSVAGAPPSTPTPATPPQLLRRLRFDTPAAPAGPSTAAPGANAPSTCPQLRAFEFVEARVGIKLHFTAATTDVHCLVTEGSEAARCGLPSGSLLVTVSGVAVEGLAPLEVQKLVQRQRPLIIEVIEPPANGHTDTPETALPTAPETAPEAALPTALETALSTAPETAPSTAAWLTSEPPVSLSETGDHGSAPSPELLRTAAHPEAIWKNELDHGDNGGTGPYASGEAVPAAEGPDEGGNQHAISMQSGEAVPAAEGPITPAAAPEAAPVAAAAMASAGAAVPSPSVPPTRFEFGPGPLGLGLSNAAGGGVFISEVHAGGAGERQGVRVGCLVLELAGVDVRHIAHHELFTRIGTLPRPLVLVTALEATSTFAPPLDFTPPLGLPSSALSTALSTTRLIQHITPPDTPPGLEATDATAEPAAVSALALQSRHVAIATGTQATKPSVVYRSHAPPETVAETVATTQLSSACAAPAAAKRRTRVRRVLGAFGRKSPSPSDYPSAVEPAAESGAQYDAPRLPGQGTSLSLAPSTTLGICAAALTSPLHRPPPRLLLTPPPAHLGLVSCQGWLQHRLQASRWRGLLRAPLAEWRWCVLVADQLRGFGTLDELYNGEKPMVHFRLTNTEVLPPKAKKPLVLVIKSLRASAVFAAPSAHSREAWRRALEAASRTAPITTPTMTPVRSVSRDAARAAAPPPAPPPALGVPARPEPEPVALTAARPEPAVSATVYEEVVLWKANKGDSLGLVCEWGHPQGGLVVGLAEGGIALAAGALKKGMLIKAVNGEPVGSASDAAAKLKAAFPEVKLLVFTPPAGASELKVHTDPFDDADGEWGEPLKPKRFSVFGKQRAKAPKTSRVEVAKDAHQQAERSPFKAVQPVPDSKHSPSKNNKNVAYAPPQKLFAVGAIAAIEPVRPAP